MPADLTAILVPMPPRGLNANDVINLIANNAPPAAWIRLVPLAAQEIHQVEVLDGGTGLPAVSPGMLVALSQNNNKALFIHVNHQSKQALLHAFEDGIEVASHTGEPDDKFAETFQGLVGHSVDDLVGADDGTRIGFGQAASHTAALVRGRLLLTPTGTPTGLGSFVFHDRGFDRPDQGSQIQLTDRDDDDAEAGDTTRAAFFAFDGAIIQQAWNELPGAQLAQVVGSAPPEVLGPLAVLRDQTARSLSQMETPPGQLKSYQPWHTHAFEIMALAHAGIFAGGDTVAYLDQKVLSLLSIGDATPIIDSDDAEELEAMPSILDAMIDVLPCPKPPGGYGPLMEQIGNEEIGALVPWAKPGEPYDGAVFLIKADRLLDLVRAFDGNKLGQRLEKFCRALYSARYGNPATEEAYLQWRAGIEEKSREDIERCLLGWAELRIVLELAAVNQMAIGVVVYG